ASTCGSARPTPPHWQWSRPMTSLRPTAARPLRLAACALALLLPAICAVAQPAPPAPAPQATSAAPLPAWEQLSPGQREALIAPIRERWNASPEDRARMLEHARRWKSMPPEERERARRSEEHTSELQSREKLVCRLLLEKKKSK